MVVKTFGVNVLEQVKQANIGGTVPVYKELNEEINALEYFAKLSDYGNKKNSILMQNNEKSFGSANPCLVVTGKGDDFEIAPLSNVGKKFVNFIKKDFKFCDKATFSKGKIFGKLTLAIKSVNEDERLKLPTHMDVLRVIASKFKPTDKPFMPYCGLFGIISSNCAPQSEDDVLKDPDYVLYFLDNMFVVDHKAKKTFLVANALITDNQKEKTYKECEKTISNYEKFLSKKVPKGKKPKKKELKVDYDMSEEEFGSVISSIKKNISDGELLYAEPSRLVTTSFNSEPFDIYSQLKAVGSTLCFINDGHGISMSSGASSYLNVVGDVEKSVELNVYTSKMPRGIVKDELDHDLDNKYEAMLKVDDKEIAYHTMLVDAMRNDVARISEAGTRHVDKLFIVDKLMQGQFCVSRVKSILDKNFDSMHAYLATANVVRGMPKLKSLQLLGKLGISFSSITFIDPELNLKSMTIEPIRIKKNLAYFRTSSRVFNNSNDELKEAEEKEIKLLDTIKNAGGLK
jgi:anthranilate synthase component I